VQFENLGVVDEELASTEGVVIELSAGGVGSNVGVEEEKLSVFDEAVGVLQVGLAVANGFDLGPAEDEAAFVTIEEKEVMGGRAIDAGVPLAAGDGISLDVLRLIGLRQLGLVACHDWYPTRAVNG
jgi:hypothetical protein